MTFIQQIMSGEPLTRVPTPQRVILTAEPNCNLACDHCYWSHDASSIAYMPTRRKTLDWSKEIRQISQWPDVHVLYAGRVLSKHGAAFIRQYYATTGKQVGMIDNGYHILKPSFRDLWPMLGHVDISIDGVEQDHDAQRGKIGSCAQAWRALLTLRDAGVSVSVASCISIHNVNKWEAFEESLCSEGISLSCTPVLSVAGNSARGIKLLDDDALIDITRRALSGMPKLFKLYDAEHVNILMPILSQYEWSDEGTYIQAYIEQGTQAKHGTRLLVVPRTVDNLIERELLWDGNFYSPHDIFVNDYASTISDSRVLQAANIYVENEWPILKALLAR